MVIFTPKPRALLGAGLGLQGGLLLEDEGVAVLDVGEGDANAGADDARVGLA